MRVPALIILAGLSLASTALALDAGVKDSSTTKIDQDISQSFKKNVELKDSKGKKKSDTWSKGKEKKRDDSEKISGSEGKAGSLDVSIEPSIYFLRAIRNLEQTGVEPYASCQVVSHPKLAADFGLTGDMGNGWVNTTKLEFMSKAATSNMPLSSVGADEEGIRNYRNCLAVYGAVVREAYLQLQEDVTGMEHGVKKTAGGEIVVRSMGLADYKVIAERALDRAVAAADRERYDYLISDDPCRFEGKTEAIQCGSVRLTLGTKPELIAAGVNIYGTQFGGLSGAYKLSSNWSLTKALEQLKSVSTFAKFATEVSDYAEKLESAGRSKEAAYARKRAVELAATSDTSINVAPFLKH